MIRPITTLNNLSNETLTKLNREGYFNVEDLLKNSEDLKRYNLNKFDIENHVKVSEVLALDMWQNETQRDNITLCCSEKEGILANGIQCGVITELTGAPFSGKTQICMQLCVSVYLSKCYGGLNGRSIYIDTRSGISALRFRGMTIFCVISYLSTLYFVKSFNPFLYNIGRVTLICENIT